MIGNAFGAWLLIFVAGTAFAALAVAIPLAVVSILSRIERVGSWALEQIRHDARGRTSASPRKRENEGPPGGDELTVQ